jgi:hypothetical protein
MSCRRARKGWLCSGVSGTWAGAVDSLDRICEEGLVVGWSTSNGCDGEALAIPKDSLQNYFRDLIWVPRIGFCLLTGLNPGMLLALSLDITSWGDIFTYEGCWTVHCVGGVEQRKKPRPTFFVSVKLGLHSDMRIWAPSSWNQRTLRV